MRRLHRLLGLVSLILLAPACKPAPAELEALAVSALQSEIPALQEQYLVAHGIYAAHIRDLTGGDDMLASGIRVILRGGTAEGWAGSSSHPEVPGAACAVYVGEPEVRISLMGGVAPQEPDVVSCIAFEPWKKRGSVERSGPYALRSTAGPR